MAPSVARAAQAPPRQDVVESRLLPANLETAFQNDESLVLACLRLALEGEKHDAVAADCAMKGPLFSKVVNGKADRGLRRVLDGMPYDVRVRFVKFYGQALGLSVRERDLGEVAEEFFAMLDRMVALAQLMRIRKPRAAKARL